MDMYSDYLWKKIHSSIDILRKTYNPLMSKQWDYDYNEICYNPAFTFNTIINNKDKNWYYYFLAASPAITVENILEDTSCREWYTFRDKVCANPNLTMDILTNKISRIHWNFYELSQNPNVTQLFIESYIHENWNWYFLSKHQNVTWDFVTKHQDKQWSYKNLSSNKNITFDTVLNNLEKPWNLYKLTENPNITFDIILSYPEYFSDEHIDNYIRTNPNVTLDFINRHNFWHHFTNNTNPISTQLPVFNNTHFIPNLENWNFQSLSSNSTLTWDYILKNPLRSWSLKNVLRNPMLYQKEQFLSKL